MADDQVPDGGLEALGVGGDVVGVDGRNDAAGVGDPGGVPAVAADDAEDDPLHGHEHAHLDVEIFSLELPGELDARRWEGWLGALIMLHAPDVFRIKAILACADEPRRQIVHGVQTYVESAAGRPWEPGEARSSRIVVIGRNLDSARWRDELGRCVVAAGV